MFWQTYKTTIKNLLRSGSFWFMVIIIFGISAYEAMTGKEIIYLQNSSTGQLKQFADTTSVFVLSYSSYIKILVNVVCANVMYYAIPVFTIVTTVLVLNRDHGDNFYEIEKSSGMTPAVYFGGRISAIVTVTFSVITAACFFSLYFYVFTRGGIQFAGTAFFVLDSVVRLMRMISVLAFPSILFYIGITYMIGTISRQGIIAAIISLSYSVSYFISRLTLRNTVLGMIYFDYFTPRAEKVIDYFYWYDTYEFQGMIGRTNLTLSQAMFNIFFLSGIFVISSLVSYIITRKREI